MVLEYVDSIDPKPHAPTPTHVRGGHTVRGGRESRCVSRSWRTSMEDAIARVLPPMPSASLAALLVPGRLRYVLLSCRYHHEHWVINAYDALVSRAEAAGLRLREAASKRQPMDKSLVASERVSIGVAAPSSSQQQAATASYFVSSKVNGALTGNRDCYACYRIALKRIVGEALSSPAFSWCSTLSREDSHLLEGCVGTSSLLNAVWFSE